MEFVSWDDDIPNMESHKNHVPNHQPEIVISHYNLVGGYLLWWFETKIRS
jgi:hypothetical protein